MMLPPPICDKKLSRSCSIIPQKTDLLMLRPFRLPCCALSIALAPFAATMAAEPPIHPWLSFETNTPSHIVISWELPTARASKVEYRHGESQPIQIPSADVSTRHHLSVPFPADTPLLYRIEQGPWHTVRPLPKRQLKAAIIGDWGYAMEKDLAAIRADQPHMLFTVGDNVPSLHEKGFEGTKAFSKMVSLAPDILASTPFMPILGNHDREITPRGPNPPNHPVYDISATAYRDFFTLPNEEWRWTFDIPAFDLRFIALDLNHVSDFGTTWQTCHDPRAEAEPLQWFTQTIDRSTQRHVIALMNEKRTSLKGKSASGNSWVTQFLRTNALVTGYGYFGEAANVSGSLPYLNTCLQGSNDKYADPHSLFITSEDTYVLLTAPHPEEPVSLELKNLNGKVLHTFSIPARQGKR